MKRSRVEDVERVVHRMLRSGEIDGWLALSTILKARIEETPVRGGMPR
jgi:hypothetical protein